MFYTMVSSVYQGVLTIRDDVTISIMYYMLGAAINNVLFDGNHRNDNNTSTSSSSLSDTAAYVIYPWLQHKYSP